MSCTRRLEFDAAHRVAGHKGKCYKLHGHRYIVEATFVARELSDIGMVVDFSEIKEKLGWWIENHWDHNTILSEEDRGLGDFIVSYTDQRVYYMKNNPTAENMSMHLLHDICPQLFSDIVCVAIKIYETPNCYAESII